MDSTMNNDAMMYQQQQGRDDDDENMPSLLSDTTGSESGDDAPRSNTDNNTDTAKNGDIIDIANIDKSCLSDARKTYIDIITSDIAHALYDFLKQLGEDAKSVHQVQSDMSVDQAASALMEEISEWPQSIRNEEVTRILQRATLVRMILPAAIKCNIMSVAMVHEGGRDFLKFNPKSLSANVNPEKFIYKILARMTEYVDVDKLIVPSGAIRAMSALSRSNLKDVTSDVISSMVPITDILDQISRMSKNVKPFKDHPAVDTSSPKHSDYDGGDDDGFAVVKAGNNNNGVGVGGRGGSMLDGDAGESDFDDAW